MSSKRTKQISLSETFESVRSAGVAEVGTIRARGIFGPFYVGVDEAGCGVFMISMTGSDAAEPSIRTQNLEADFGLDCQLEIGGKPHTLVLSKVHCLDTDPRTTAHFMSLCESIMGLIGSEPSARAVHDSVLRIASLFLSFNETPRSTWAGLIGELTFLLSLVDADSGVRAWRMDDADRVDFVFDAYRVEIKCTTKRERKHLVTYEQANNFSSKSTYIGSIFLERLDHGFSVSDAVSMLENRCTEPELRFKLREIVATTLGSNLRFMSEECFDVEFSLGSIQLYDAAEIPAIRGEVPAGVSRVTFESDFSGAMPAAGGPFNFRSELGS
jgi:hypothetical protein